MDERSETVTLTRDLIRQGRSDAGGFSRRQLSLLGVAWPPQKGWLKRSTGKSVRTDIFQQFLALAKRSA